MSGRHLALSGLAALALATSAAAQDGAAARTVVVELFTSQGCSSCPPADRLLRELGADGWRGVEVIPLSFHVDYWNYIGWTDPFSSARWSERQRRYGARFASATVYTPQVVVDGRSECVGSRRAEVGRYVDDAAARADAGAVRVRLTDPDRLTIEARLERRAGTDADVVVAVYETGLTTEVGSGENARRTLANDYVVRSLVAAGSLRPGESGELDHALELDPSWRRGHLGVAVFLQSPTTLEIFGAASLPL